jgi:hypothetical protein
MPWDIRSYYITSGRVLNVEITIPLLEFLYEEAPKVEEVKDAWFQMLRQFVTEEPDYEASWEMQPEEDVALVTIRIAKRGELEEFTMKEIESAISASDALFEKENV